MCCISIVNSPFTQKKTDQHFSRTVQREIKHMYIMVPALNEANEIVGTVNQLLRSMEPLPIESTLVIINDGSDDGTDIALDEFANNPHVHVITRELPHAREGKGAALNDGLDWIAKQTKDLTHTVVGVIDSDASPSFKILFNVYRGFIHSKYDLLQTGITINNVHNFLTLMQEFEFGVPNLLQQVIRMDWGSAIASGDGQFMTLEMASKIRWNNSLLDDLEFSLNGLLHGFTGGFLPYTLLPQEGVLTYRALIKQRVRWCHGGMQCLIRYGKQLFLSKIVPSKLKTDLITFMLIPFISIIFIISSLIASIVLIVHFVAWPQKTFIVLVIILILGIAVTTMMILAANHYGIQAGRTYTFREITTMIVGNFAYSWMLAPVSFIALTRLVLRRNEWAKTAHDHTTVQENSNSFEADYDQKDQSLKNDAPNDRMAK
ncbi:glycosyltransferase [Lactobacillus helveticus]|nr:glycosyltransferase [Lactobacillus helveticus]